MDSTQRFFSGGIPTCPHLVARCLAGIVFKIDRISLLERRAFCTFSAGKQKHLLLRHLCFVFVIGANDALHKVMTHYVAFVEMNESQTLDTAKDVHGFEQAAAAGV